MGNPNRGEATFEALGESWTLRYNTNALAEFEDVSGIPVAAISSERSIKVMRALVWAGLGFHHSRKRGDLKNVGNMIDEVGSMEMANLTMKALSSAFPSSEGGAESPPSAAQSEGGSNS